MPFLMNYTLNGTNYPNSWWITNCVNVSQKDKSATVVCHGYTDKVSYETDGFDPIDIQIFECPDSDVYDRYFGNINASVGAYMVVVENFLRFGGPTFFGAATVFSPVDYYSGHVATIDPLYFTVGLASPSEVFINFFDGVETVTDFIDGVTIKINGTPATISSAVQGFDPKALKYTLSAAIDPSQTISFQYDSGPGAIRDLSHVQISSIDEKPIVNMIGSTCGFNYKQNSGHIAHL